MQHLGTLYTLLEAIDQSWADRETVDWSEAEQIVELCKQVPDALRQSMSVILQIIEYANSNEEWDCGIVGIWPDQIRREIEQAEKSYHYRADAENWEVYSLSMTGEEEWKATVETEAMAQRLVSVLMPVDSGSSSECDSASFQPFADEYMSEMKAAGSVFSGEQQRVRIYLAACTRHEQSVCVSLPKEMDDYDLRDFVDSAYCASDRTDFVEDTEYWEKGDCRSEIV